MLQELGISLSLGEFDFCGHLLSCVPTRVNPAAVMGAAGRGHRWVYKSPWGVACCEAHRSLGSSSEGRLKWTRKLKWESDLFLFLVLEPRYTGEEMAPLNLLEVCWRTVSRLSHSFIEPGHLIFLPGSDPGGTPGRKEGRAAGSFFS